MARLIKNFKFIKIYIHAMFIMNMNILSENHVDIIRWQVDNIKIMLPFFYYPASPQFQ